MIITERAQKGNDITYIHLFYAFLFLMIDIITIKWTHKRNNMRNEEEEDEQKLYLKSKKNLHSHAIILRLAVVFLCQSLSFLKVIAHFFYRL